MFLGRILPLRASLVQAGQQSGAHEISAWLKPPVSSCKVLLMNTRYGTLARRGSQKHKGLLTDPLLSLCCSINMIYLLLIIEQKCLFIKLNAKTIDAFQVKYIEDYTRAPVSAHQSL